MSQSEIHTIPLFPLSKPVFPSIPQALRIFEQRYLTMISRVMRGEGTFGIVPIASGQEAGLAAKFHPFGTLVKIVDWQQLEDGLLGITVIGERRFKVCDSVVDDKQLITADVDLFAEQTQIPPQPHHEDLYQLFESLTNHPMTQHLKADGEKTLFQLSWLLAELLPLPPETKIQLLSIVDFEQRIALIREGVRQLS